MKKKMVALVVSSMIASSMTGCQAKTNEASTPAADTATPSPAVTATPTPTLAPTTTPAPIKISYKDGTYTAKTDPDHEGYYETATIEVKDGAITKVDWGIFDSTRNDMPFDDKYEKVYSKDQKMYIEQCRTDWKGSRGYASELISTQNINKVDSVSGATWTNQLFKAVVRKALHDAEAE